MDPSFRIESIENHMFIDGQLALYVKWVGLESCKNTWELRSTVRDQNPKLLIKYRKDKMAAIRKDKKAALQRTRHRKTTTATILKNKKEEKVLERPLVMHESVNDFKAPSKNWEKDAEIVGISMGKDKQWQFDLKWPDGHITLAHPLKHVRVRCPQKLIELFVTNAELE